MTSLYIFYAIHFLCFAETEELRIVYFSTSVGRIVKRKGTTGECVRYEISIKFWWDRLKEGEHPEDLGVDRTIIFKQILKNSAEGAQWTGFI
jgi:hypothetical protein